MFINMTDRPLRDYKQAPTAILKFTWLSLENLKELIVTRRVKLRSKVNSLICAVQLRKPTTVGFLFLHKMHLILSEISNNYICMSRNKVKR